MAVSSKIKGQSLRVITGGTDAQGKEVKATKTFSDINQAASDAQLYTGAKAIHTLYSGTLDDVQVITTRSLSED